MYNKGLKLKPSSDLLRQRLGDIRISTTLDKKDKQQAIFFFWLFHQPHLNQVVGSGIFIKCLYTNLKNSH
jgi:hypothetical protein